MTQHSEITAEAFAFLGTVRKKDVSILERAVLLQALTGAHHSHRMTTQLFSQLQAVCTEEWVRTSPLTTVFAVANALHFYDERAVHGRLIGVLAQRLMTSEKNPGGPYAESGTEPDSFTNSLIAVFAEWAAGTLPGTYTFLQQQINQGLHSQFAPDFILQRYLEMISDLPPAEAAAPRTIDNVFAAAAAIWEPARAAEEKTIISDADLSAAVLTLIAHELDRLPAPLDQQAKVALERVGQADTHHEITLFSHYFQAALLQNNTHNTTRLGVANVYCWIAYMAYDRILDDGAGIDLLPLANVAHRKALQHYRHALPEAESLIEATFTRMDQANAWEQLHARAPVHDGTLFIKTLPEFGNGHHLAARSFAHALGPLLIAVDSGQQLQAEPLQLLRTAFSHYLIARQLNDDAHDWQDDIANGRLTFVVTELLRAQNILHGEINLAAILPMLQQLFRESVAQDIANLMMAHGTKAKELFAQSKLLRSDSMLEQLCNNLEASAQRMTTLSKDSEDLLSTF